MTYLVGLFFPSFDLFYSERDALILMIVYELVMRTAIQLG